MKRMRIEAIYRRPNTSKPAPWHKVYPHLLQKLAVTRPNQVWATDIPMARGFIYLVAVVDWFTRRVLAWRVSISLDAEFCIEALEEALVRYGKPAIFNSDQGSQFTSAAFTAVLHREKIAISTDGTGCWRDNVFVVRLWRSVKYEEVYLNAYASVPEARAGIDRYIGFYNAVRPHSTLGGRTPDEVYFDQPLLPTASLCKQTEPALKIDVTAPDTRLLEAIVAARSSAQKHVWRARIVLLTTQGLGTQAIMGATGKSKTCVWRWQERFMAEGVDGLLRDKTRPPGIAPLAAALVDKVVALTLEPPSQEATHWTVRAMAKAVGIAASSVVKIWHDHGLAPHRWRSFKLSNDKAFAEKLHDVVGLYVSPPAHAIVLSVDEKSQIQALERTQPGLPLKRGRATMTHDYKRNGTTTLFAALNVLDGSVIGRNMQRHRHQEFIRFLNAIEAEMPADKAIHLILDNYATHKQPKVRAWLARHPRWTFHFVPTSCSWLNAVEGFFAKLTRRRLKNGVLPLRR